MRIVAATVFSGFVLGAWCAGAQTAEIAAFSLVGKWAVSAPAPNGQTMTTELTLMPNMNFSGSSSVKGRLFWTFSGTWEVKGDEVIWHYENSSLHCLNRQKSMLTKSFLSMAKRWCSYQKSMASSMPIRARSRPGITCMGHLYP